MPAPSIRLPGVNDEESTNAVVGAAPQISFGAPENVMTMEARPLRQGPFDTRQFVEVGAPAGNAHEPPRGLPASLSVGVRAEPSEDVDGPAPPAVPAPTREPLMTRQTTARDEAAVRAAAAPPVRAPAAAIPTPASASGPVRLESIEKTYTTTTHPMDVEGLKQQGRATSDAIQALEKRHEESNRRPVQIVMPANANAVATQAAKDARAQFSVSPEQAAANKRAAVTAMLDGVDAEATKVATVVRQQALKAGKNEEQANAEALQAYQSVFAGKAKDAEVAGNNVEQHDLARGDAKAKEAYDRVMQDAAKRATVRELPSINDQKLARSVQMMDTIDREQRALDKYRSRFDAEREQRAERADEAQMRAAQMGDRLDPNRVYADRGVPQIAVDALGSFLGGLTRAHNGGRNVYLDSMEAARQTDYQGQLDRLAAANRDLQNQQHNAADFARGGQAKLADFEARRARALGDFDAYLKGLDVALLPAEEKARLKALANEMMLKTNQYRAEQFKGQQSTVQDKRVDKDALMRGSGGQQAEAAGMVVPDLGGNLTRVRKGYEEEARHVPKAISAMKAIREDAARLKELYDSLPAIGPDRLGWSTQKQKELRNAIAGKLHIVYDLGGRSKEELKASIPEQTLLLDDATRLQEWVNGLERWVDDRVHEFGTAEAVEAPTQTGYATGNTGRVKRPDTSRPDDEE